MFPTTAMALRLSWERLRRRAGLEDLRFHDLRHEAISRFCIAYVKDEGKWSHCAEDDVGVRARFHAAREFLFPERRSEGVTYSWVLDVQEHCIVGCEVGKPGG